MQTPPPSDHTTSHLLAAEADAHRAAAPRHQMRAGQRAITSEFLETGATGLQGSSSLAAQAPRDPTPGLAAMPPAQQQQQQQRPSLSASALGALFVTDTDEPSLLVSSLLQGAPLVHDRSVLQDTSTRLLQVRSD